MTIAIILAAGDSKRVRGINKIFYRISGKPLIFYTI
ncbi:MAG: molybdenum cofactor guanylyltransferase MobA, partial [Candidatus Nealsonbacteria bacterium CG_4_10_14_3_um_filter_36_16]